MLTALQYLSIATTIFLLARLVSQDLHKAYRWFFVYLLIDLAGSLAGLVALTGPAVIWRYVFATVPRVIALGFVVLEIYQLALSDRQGLARAGRKFVLGGLLVGILISLLEVVYTGPRLPDQSVLMRKQTLLEISLGAPVLLLLAVMAGFLAWFPIQLRKNLVNYILGFVGFFAIHWGSRMAYLRLHVKEEIQALNLISYALTQACIFVWIFALKHSGETEQKLTTTRWNPDQMEQKKRQLDEINRDLERLVR